MLDPRGRNLRPGRYMLDQSQHVPSPDRSLMQRASELRAPMPRRLSSIASAWPAASGTPMTAVGAPRELKRRLYPGRFDDPGDGCGAQPAGAVAPDRGLSRVGLPQAESQGAPPVAGTSAVSDLSGSPPPRCSRPSVSRFRLRSRIRPRCKSRIPSLRPLLQLRGRFRGGTVQTSASLLCEDMHLLNRNRRCERTSRRASRHRQRLASTDFLILRIYQRISLAQERDEFAATRGSRSRWARTSSRRSHNNLVARGGGRPRLRRLVPSRHRATSPNNRRVLGNSASDSTPSEVPVHSKSGRA